MSVREAEIKKVIMAARIVFLLLFPLMATSLTSPASGATDLESDHRLVLTEERLYHKLMVGYNKIVHPSLNTTQLKFGVGLKNLIGLDSRRQVLTTDLWVRHYWTDFRLKWNTTEYEVSEIRMDIRDLWTPDILLCNSMEGRDSSYWYDALAVVSSDGGVLWIPPMRAKSHCVLDFTWFPFDEQDCSLTFASWTYHGFRIHLTFLNRDSNVDITGYMRHPEWAILKTSARIHVKYYPCCREPYEDVTFTIRLGRISFLYRGLFVGPAALMAMLAPFLFMLPPGTGEKTTLGVGILIILFLLMMMLDNYIGQAQAGNCILGYFYYITFILVCFSTALSALVSNMALRGPRTGAPPIWMRKMFLDRIGRLVLVSYTQADSTPDGVTSDTSAIVNGTNESTRGVREYQLMAMVFDRLLFVAAVLFFVLITISMVAK